MNLSNILKIASQVSGVASMIPGAGAIAAPLSMGLNFASSLVPQGNNNVNQGGVDVTGQLKGPSMFTYQTPSYSAPTPTQKASGVYDNSFMYRDTNPFVEQPVNNTAPNWYGASNSASGMQDVINNMINVKNYPMGKGLSSGIPDSLIGNDNNANMTAPNGFLNPNGKMPLKAIAGLNNIIGNRNSFITNGEGSSQDKSEELVGKEMLKNANEFAGTMDKIGTGAFMLGSAISLYNELNKKPSEMAVAPQFKTVDLDSNQSATINAGTREIQKGKNFQQRIMQDLGVDPMLAGVMLESMANDSKTKLLSESERTRQSIEATQEQLNASIQGQAGQSKMATDQFNIQKQMQENQMASVNISQSIMGMVNALPAYGQSNFARKYQMYDLFYNR